MSEFEDYGPAHSTQISQQNYRKEQDARRDAIADADRKANEANKKRREGAPVVARHATKPEVSKSAETIVAQEAVGPTQLDRKREARDATRYKRRLEAEKPPKDTRTTAEKIADRYAPGR